MENKFNDDLETKAANFDRCYGFTHAIKPGDTLYKLSRQYNVKVSALILANPYVNIYNLQVGDTLCIPRIRPIVVPVPPYPPTMSRPSTPSQPPMPEGMRPPTPSQPPMPEGMRPPTPSQPSMPEGMRPPTPSQPSMPEGMRPPTPSQPSMPEEESRPMMRPERSQMPEEEFPPQDMEPEMRMVRPETAVMPGNEESQMSFDMPDLPVTSEEVREEETEIHAEEQGVPEWADLKSRIDTMTVRELLDEWDITYPMLTTCLDIIKKM